MTPGLVSVLILNWNGAQFLSRCLASVRAQTYRLLEIVVIDNGKVVANDTLAGLHELVPVGPGGPGGNVSLESVFLTLTGRSLRD